MLRQFLPSVLKYTQLHDVEIVVADNGSTDASLALLEAEFPTVHTIVFEENYGFADGYNRAFEQIDAEYAVLLNSDVEVTEGWWQPLVEVLDGEADVAVIFSPSVRLSTPPPWIGIPTSIPSSLEFSAYLPMPILLPL